MYYNCKKFAIYIKKYISGLIMLMDYTMYTKNKYHYINSCVDIYGQFSQARSHNIIIVSIILL